MFDVYVNVALNEIKTAAEQKKKFFSRQSTVNEIRKVNNLLT